MLVKNRNNTSKQTSSNKKHIPEVLNWHQLVFFLYEGKKSMNLPDSSMVRLERYL